MERQERELLVKKLRYRTWHRGCKETDILLGKFSDQYIADFDDTQLMQLKEICEVDDWDLYAWITGSKPIPEEYNNEVMQLILKFDCS
ncbi:MAG: succinate dehydrogenase assembly factor 2 [Rickettsiales bacterium]|nr:succinate dehydrogenase assembly factor 2 [Rickettsiales bacterium]